jgi:apolipoprotein N-acyltransferase
VEKKKSLPEQDPPPKKDSKKESGVNAFTRYSGVGIQMVLIILLFYWAGSKLDERAGTEKPVYTAISTLLGVFAGLYITLKEFIRKKDD